MLKFDAKIPTITMRRLSDDFERKFIAEVAEPEMLNQIRIMKKRAESNQRAAGGSIRASYSDSYLRAIISGTAVGANGVRKSTTSVNLTVTGEFLSSMQVKKIKAGAQAFFSGNHGTTGRGSLQNASLAGYLFDMGFDGWFDFSPEDKTRIMKKFSSFVDKYTKDLVTITP